MKNVAFAVTALLAAPLAAGAAVLYVKASGTGNCSSWSAACATPDAAMTLASAGDEIWVAAVPLDPGTGIDYYYLSSSSTPSGLGIVNVKDGVSIYGGFNGTETTRGQRNVTGNVTKFLLEMRYRALADLATTIDGFTFVDGSDAPFLLGDDGSAGTCSLLTISHNSFKNSGFTLGAIYAWQPPFLCSPTIQGNTFY